MPARSFKQPPNAEPHGPDDLFTWFVYLCLNSDCRGLGGYELALCSGLLSLGVLRRVTKDKSAQSRAYALRRLLERLLTTRCAQTKSPALLATLHLMGLTPAAAGMPRPIRRKLAADTMGMALDTFQRRYERRLLRDAADELWRVEEVAARVKRRKVNRVPVTSRAQSHGTGNTA